MSNELEKNTAPDGRLPAPYYTERRQRWVEKLRSGNTNKATGVLCKEVDGVKHCCCLGEELLLSDMLAYRTFIHSAPKYVSASEDVIESHITHEDYENLGLFSAVGAIVPPLSPEINSLTNMNDSSAPEFSHKDIGDFILNNPERVFTPV